MWKWFVRSESSNFAHVQCFLDCCSLDSEMSTEMLVTLVFVNILVTESPSHFIICFKTTTLFFAHTIGNRLPLLSGMNVLLVEVRYGTKVGYSGCTLYLFICFVCFKTCHLLNVLLWGIRLDLLEKLLNYLKSLPFSSRSLKLIHRILYLFTSHHIPSQIVGSLYT